MFKKILLNSYVTLIVIFLFAKEWIIINQELMVILGFITIFLTLKSLLEVTITEALNDYSEAIRQKVLNTLKIVFLYAQKDSKTRELNTETFQQQTAFYRYTRALTLLKFQRTLKKALQKVNQQSEKRQKTILRCIFKEKRRYYSLLFRPNFKYSRKSLNKAKKNKI